MAARHLGACPDSSPTSPGWPLASSTTTSSSSAGMLGQGGWGSTTMSGPLHPSRLMPLLLLLLLQAYHRPRLIAGNTATPKKTYDKTEIGNTAILCRKLSLKFLNIAYTTRAPACPGRSTLPCHLLNNLLLAYPQRLEWLSCGRWGFSSLSFSSIFAVVWEPGPRKTNQILPLTVVVTGRTE